MDAKKLFEKYRKRLERIGTIKALFMGSIVGFALEFVVAFVIWFFHMSVPIAILIMLGTAVAATLMFAPIFYVLFFRPSERKIARMIDRMGLEERLVTMCDKEEDDSLMAKIQRKDAQEKLSSVSEKQLMLHFSRAAIAALAVSISLGLAMGTVSALSAGGVIQSAGEIFEDLLPDPDKVPPDAEEDNLLTVTYLAGEGGRIDGESVQKLEKGQDTSLVTAVAEEGYEFVGWSDGNPRATRVDYNVQENFTVTARFAKKVAAGIPGGPGGVPGESGGDGPSLEGGEAIGGGAGGSGNGGMNDGEDENGAGGGGAGATGDNEDNSVIDGYKDYKDVFDFDAALEELLNDDSIPDDMKDFLIAYLEALRAMQEADKNN